MQKFRLGLLRILWIFSIALTTPAGITGVSKSIAVYVLQSASSGNATLKSISLKQTGSDTELLTDAGLDDVPTNWVINAGVTDNADGTVTMTGTSVSAEIKQDIALTANTEYKLETGESFSGSGSAAQSNSLRGQLSATVVRVFNNGNMEIMGQKKLTLNNGNEHVRLRGIIRPEDISANNIIQSSKIVDAEITYTGAGQTHDSARMGWLTRGLRVFSPF